MRVTKLLVASILLFMVSSTEGRTTRTQHAPRPLSVADVEHGLKSAVPNARMAALVRKYGVDFELTHTVQNELRSAGASDNLILQIGRSRSRVVGKPVRPAGHTVVDRALGSANTTRAHAETSAKEFLSQADKYRVGDEGKAAELYRKAADMGNAEAQTRFAEALFDGRGVARDPAGSRPWLEKAARQSNARAECDLGVVLTSGLDFAQDRANGLQYLQSAARLGDGYAEDSGSIGRE
jgi:Sel1 repeat